MFGRDNEIGAIKSALKTAQSGRGGATFVVGEGGIGKSRLASTAASLAGDADMRILRGRGSSVGRMVPFRSLTEALMSLLRSSDSIDIEQLGPYRPILARLIPDWGTPASPEQGGSLVVLAEAVLRLADLAGRDHGCLLILDDLQDADAETLAVVDYLVDNIGQQATMLLAVVRAEPCPALDLARSAAQRGYARLLELRRLSRAEVGSLAAAWLDCTVAGVPAEVVDQLWTDSGGIPLLAEELLESMLRAGLLAPADEDETEGWRVTGELRTKVPATLTRTLAERLDRIGPQGRDLLSVAAVLGHRFPLAVLQAATGLGNRELLSYLHTELTAQFVAPDEEAPDWYAFQHPLFVEALLTLTTPDERSRAARQAAEAVEAVFPGIPGEWCQLSAELRLQAGQPGAAGRLLAEAGRRALGQGAANSAVSLLDKALELLTHEDDVQVRADAFASLLLALAEAGLVQRAVTSAEELDQFACLLSSRARARLHSRLAWAAAVAGRSEDGLAQIEVARRLLGPDATDEDTAPIDVVAAHLMLDLRGPDQLRSAEQLARRAAKAAESAQLPVVACQAWQLLGALSRSRDLAEATACLEQARQLAVRHGLAIEEIHALVRLGNDEALRDGSVDRLEKVRLKAAEVGAVTARYQAEQSIALYRILRGEFAAAGELIDQVLEPAARLRLLETVRYVLLLRATLAAHRGQRRAMEAAFAELRAEAGEHAQHTPRAHGLARAWCALLEENRPLAREELTLALAAEEQSPTVYQLTGRYGLHLLLRVLDGDASWPEYEEVVTARASQLRWDRQFALLACAVLHGRAGQSSEAVDAVRAAVRAAAPFAGARHLGLRLVSEAAVADGWGSPVDWLRDAEEYFHHGDVVAVAGACRSLMRRAGARVTQRRPGAHNIPLALRTSGVTVREYEVLKLLTQRLGNREIADRLSLSPRTVEKHVAALIVKTGQPNRIALSEFGLAVI